MPRHASVIVARLAITLLRLFICTASYDSRELIYLQYGINDTRLPEGLEDSMQTSQTALTA